MCGFFTRRCIARLRNGIYILSHQEEPGWRQPCLWRYGLASSLRDQYAKQHTEKACGRGTNDLVRPSSRRFPAMSLLPFFAWCESSALGGTIRSSSWLFPVIEAFHLLGLAVIGGAVLVVDLRLFGFGLRRQPVAQLAQDAQRWLIISLMVMIATGS